MSQFYPSREGKVLRALITGIAGFAGSHLCDYLLSLGGIQVSGACLPSDSLRHLNHCLSQIDLHRLDLTDYQAVITLLEKTRPDYLFHLAAQASVRRAWEHPAETLVNNAAAQLNVLHAIVQLNMRPRVLVVGSADEYGLIPQGGLPVDEETPLRPLNPYAVSKIAQDFLGLQYHLSHGLHVVRVRPFNHIGPRQGLGFVVPDFCKQIAEIELGRREPVVRVGNLSARRDFTDVRDMVRAYYLALAKGKPGEVYNIGSGRALAIHEVLDCLLQQSRVPVRVEQDPGRMRPSDIPVIICDSRRFRQDTGWRPERDIKQTLRETLDYWREQVQNL